jgi:hypothetical protein
MYYYVDNPAKLQPAMRDFLDAQPAMSVKVVARDDPHWETIHEVLNAARKSPAHGAQPSVAADAPQAARR